MAAPSPTTRTPPTGQPMRDGYQTLITFENADSIIFWEKGVQPPGLEGGDPIDATTMHNETWRTFGTPALITLTPSSTRVAYDPAVFDTIVSIINVETTITITFPDGSTLAFFGRLQNFEPDELVEGSQPEASVTIAATNWDTGDNTEAAPLYTAS